MTHTFTGFALATCLFLTAFTGRAQFAFVNAPLPAEATATADPGEVSKAVLYKVLHGVVQGAKGVLPGATVWLHGTRTIVVTNSEGEFELRVPSTATEVKLTCGYGGLSEEEVTLAPVQALGSIYLLRSQAPAAN